MKIGDKVTVIVHGAGVTSEEDYHTIEEIDEKTLKVEYLEDTFYKTKKGNYKTERSLFGFQFEIKGE